MASTAKNSRTHNVMLAANVSHIAGNQFLKKSNCSTDLRVHHPKIYERIIDKMMCIKYVGRQLFMFWILSPFYINPEASAAEVWSICRPAAKFEPF